jgi:hypothetical protein
VLKERHELPFNTLNPKTGCVLNPLSLLGETRVRAQTVSTAC